MSRLALGVTGATLACLPDIDVVGFRFGIEYASPWGHRGFTHSLGFALAASLAAGLAVIRANHGTLRAGAVLALLFTAAASHGVLDAFTDAGLGVGFFVPFDDTRIFFTHRPLATSPIGVGAFFRESSLAILANEFVWVWLPWLAALFAAVCTRALGARLLGEAKGSGTD